ncbi:MAG: CinA family protein [Alphaproteobacteria bacterium]|nr:CinA family protein [Alphaproteobacteria bacterium]
MFNNDLIEEAQRLISLYRSKGMKIATAESCTGGLISALLTEIAGSSDVFDRGFVTYSNDSKCTIIDVPLALIKEHGAVSEEVASAMAYGALENSAADVAVSVTGIAGPGGGSVQKPVGTVFLAVATRSNQALIERCQLEGDRSEIRLQALGVALGLLRQMASRSSVSFA